MNPIAYQRVVAGIYADDRFRDRDSVKAGVRELALAMAWLLHFEPTPATGYGRRLREILGNDPGVNKPARFDLPRYEPPSTGWHRWSTCEGVMVRRDGLCKQNPQWGYRHVYARSGQWRQVGFCTRHRPEGERAKAANLREVESVEHLPEPVPNRGGVLPGHLPELNWEGVYRHVAPNWVYPSYGIVADRWPEVCEFHASGKPKLAVISNDDEVSEADDLSLPTLRLVAKPDSGGAA